LTKQYIYVDSTCNELTKQYIYVDSTCNELTKQYIYVDSTCNVVQYIYELIPHLTTNSLEVLPNSLSSRQKKQNTLASNAPSFFSLSLYRKLINIFQRVEHIIYCYVIIIIDKNFNSLSVFSESFIYGLVLNDCIKLNVNYSRKGLIFYYY
jgi:hypothetical protein